MLRDRVKVKKTVVLSLTAEDWDLYTDKSDCDAIANFLNTNLEVAVNTGMGAESAYHYMMKLMKDFSDYGAMDSEPIRVLDRLINYIYGDSEL